MSTLSVAAHLREVVSVKRLTGHTSAGDPVRAAAVTLAARVERTLSEVGVANGRDSTAGAVVFTASALELGDLVFLAEDDTANDDTGRAVVETTKRVALDGSVTHYVARV